MKITIAIALLGLAGCTEYDDPLQAAVRAHMLQSDRDTQYMVEHYKAEIARIDKQEKELDKINSSYASEIERMRKEDQEAQKRKAELKRLSRFLDKLQEQEDQEQHKLRKDQIHRVSKFLSGELSKGLPGGASCSICFMGTARRCGYLTL